MISLRPYQEELIVGVRQHFRQQRKRVLVQLGTGGGKTAICSRMLNTAASRGKRVWFICHRRELVRQIAKALTLEGVEFGLVTAKDRMNLAAPAQICSIPTLINRLDRLPEPDMIAWDECHHQAAGTWSSIAKRFPDAYHIGLSATPRRLDGAGLGDYYNAMVIGPSIAWMIENRYLSKFRLFSHSVVDTSRLHTRMGDFVKSEANALMNKPKIIGTAIQHYKKHIDGARALVFCVSVEHSQAMSVQFNAAGIPAMHVDGKTDDWIREGAIDDLGTNKLKVLTNCNLFAEGVDVPCLDAVIDQAPTKSESIYLQRGGRMLRPFEGKEYGYYLDMAGNAELHGLFDDERTWELTCGKPEKNRDAIPPPRICGMCFAANRTGATICKVCKTVFPVEGRQVEQVEGELAEIDAAREKREARIAQGLTKDLESLTALGRMRGYKDPASWAAHVIAGREKKKAAGR